MKVEIILDAGSSPITYSIGIANREEGDLIINRLESAEGKTIRIAGDKGDMLINTSRLITATVRL
jgi:hypothetical protein